jgi:hypothetical protein
MGTRARRGQVPYGWKVDPAAPDGALVEDPEEQVNIATIVGLAREGSSYRDIAAELECRGRPPRGAAWHATTIARIVQQHLGASPRSTRRERD